MIALIVTKGRRIDITINSILTNASTTLNTVIITSSWPLAVGGIRGVVGNQQPFAPPRKFPTPKPIYANRASGGFSGPNTDGCLVSTGVTCAVSLGLNVAFVFGSDGVS